MVRSTGGILLRVARKNDRHEQNADTVCNYYYSESELSREACTWYGKYLLESRDTTEVLLSNFGKHLREVSKMAKL